MIEVTDDGRPAARLRRNAAVRRPAQRALMPGTGRGLLGMRERVCLYGGELDARPRPGGGWLVRATIPDAAAPARGRRRLARRHS